MTLAVDNHSLAVDSHSLAVDNHSLAVDRYPQNQKNLALQEVAVDRWRLPELSFLVWDSTCRQQGAGCRQLLLSQQFHSSVKVKSVDSVALWERVRVLLTPLEEFRQYLSTVTRCLSTDEGRMSADEVYLSTATEFYGILGSGSRILVDKTACVDSPEVAVDRWRLPELSLLSKCHVYLKKQNKIKAKKPKAMVATWSNSELSSSGVEVEESKKENYGLMIIEDESPE
ncbi:hypothetical protein Taro_015928, partial [Colocasia esculenta]|nr:hypothetical protein [Colocasia esculenta]